MTSKIILAAVWITGVRTMIRAIGWNGRPDRHCYGSFGRRDTQRDRGASLTSTDTNQARTTTMGDGVYKFTLVPPGSTKCVLPLASILLRSLAAIST